MKNKISGIYLVVVTVMVVLAAQAHAQFYRVEGGAAEFNYMVKGDPQERSFFFEVNAEGPVVRGAPYTAKGISTSTQTLADGNKIKHTNEVSLARDSEGRSRREQNLGAVGPWETNSKGSIVTISDPVAHVRYEMVPDGGKLIARKMEMHERVRSEARAKLEAERQVHSGSGTGVGVGVGVDESGPVANVVFMRNPGEQGLIEKKIAEGAALSGEEAPKVEQLGEQTIEGVTASGTRRSYTIPAGKIGNDQPITVTSEIWYSPELKMVVLSKRSDPRLGESEYRLTNIQRGEPAASLFQVPAGYEVRDMYQKVRDF